MKKRNWSQLIRTLCNTCIAFAGIMAMRHASFVFFGEPKFPQEEE